MTCCVETAQNDDDEYELSQDDYDKCKAAATASSGEFYHTDVSIKYTFIYNKQLKLNYIFIYNKQLNYLDENPD